VPVNFAVYSDFKAFFWRYQRGNQKP